MSRDARLVRAGTAPLPHEPLPGAQVSSGAPTTGLLELGTLGDVEYGIWEITPGVSTDVEADEVFVVLSGRARIDFADGSVEIGAGDVVRLRAGERTVWTVTETLRKVYVTA